MQKQNNSSSCIESCCVNGCPASLEAWGTASVLSVDSASFSGVSRAFRVVREGSIFCNFVMPVFLYKSFATGSAYYVLRNCRLQGSGNPNCILYSAKLLIAGLRQLAWHTIFCQRAEKCRQQPNRHNLYSNAMCLCGCMVHIVMIMWI